MITSLTQNDAFMDAVGQLPHMAYDWICEMANCSSFVCDKEAWDYFYNMFDNTQPLDA